MSNESDLALYRHLIALYPKSFRNNYEPDLIVLFEAQLRDEARVRVWLRVVRDLAVSVPMQHLEAHVTRPSPYFLPLLSAVVAGAATFLALVIGTGAALPVVLVVALLSSAMAIWSFQLNRPIPDHTPVRSWWKFLLAGPVLAGLTFAGMAFPWPASVDLGDNAYWLVVMAFLLSLVTAAVGVVLGLLALIQRRRGRGVRISMI